ncbi:MAG: hypothetical protein R2748_16760 [Bryobacterales bacterium]
MRALIGLVFTCALTAAPAGWAPWAAREEIAPNTWVDANHSRSGNDSLAISGASNLGAYGGWDRVIEGVEPGKWYRATAYYQAQGIEQERQQVLARLAWRKAGGKTAWAARLRLPFGARGRLDEVDGGSPSARRRRVGGRRAAPRLCSQGHRLVGRHLVRADRYTCGEAGARLFGELAAAEHLFQAKVDGRVRVASGA